MTLKVFGRELEELVPYGMVVLLYVNLVWFERDIASYTEITYFIGWYIVLGTFAIFLLIRYEFKRLREQVLVELRRDEASPPRTAPS